MKITAEPRSDQYNADDFVQGPREFTVAGVRAGTAEQKYDILLDGETRCWRPPLTVLRLLMAAWGDEATTWVGKRVRLYRDPTIRFGKDLTGGIRVSHLSGIDKPLTVSLTATRGKRASHTVEPLPDVAPAHAEPTAADVAASTDVLALKAMWRASGPERRAQIEARVSELNATPAIDPSAPDPDDPDPTLGADWPTVTQGGERR